MRRSLGYVVWLLTTFLDHSHHSPPSLSSSQTSVFPPTPSTSYSFYPATAHQNCQLFLPSHFTQVSLCVCAELLSRVQIFATPWIVAHQAPLSMGFPRQEYWSGLPFLLQGIFPTQGSNLGLLHCRHTLYHLRHQIKRIQSNYN